MERVCTVEVGARSADCSLVITCRYFKDNHSYKDFVLSHLSRLTQTPQEASASKTPRLIINMFWLVHCRVARISPV
jgi:hypothetical protein